MDRLRAYGAFLAVAEEGAFNAAAKRLNISPPAVTRLVGMLEAQLGVKLFTRTTRQVVLTEAGSRLRDDATRILAELSEAEASAAGAHDAPRGELRVTAPVLFGQRFIAPILRDYLDRYPAVTASTLFVDRIVDLIDEGQDVALRIGDLPDSSLIATRIGTVRRVTIASPAYLADRPPLQQPDDLQNHRIILPTGANAAPSWAFISEEGRKTVRLAPALRVNTMSAAIDAAIAGWGVTRVLSYQVGDAIGAGALVEVLRESEDRSLPIHLVQAEGRRSAAKIRAFVDFAGARLRRETNRLEALPRRTS